MAKYSIDQFHVSSIKHLYTAMVHVLRSNKGREMLLYLNANRNVALFIYSEM